MTENETIELLRSMQNPKQDYAGMRYVQDIAINMRRKWKMLYPTIELEEKHTYCTCGAPNFRSVSEWNKPIKRIFKLTLPKAPCGNTMHYLCEDCLKKIREGEQNE